MESRHCNFWIFGISDKEKNQFREFHGNKIRFWTFGTCDIEKEFFFFVKGI